MSLAASAVKGLVDLDTVISIPPANAKHEATAFSCKVSVSNHTELTVYSKMPNMPLVTLEPMYSERNTGSVVVRREYQWGRSVDILNDPVFKIPDEELSFKDLELKKMFLEEKNRNNPISNVVYETVISLKHFNEEGGLVTLPDEHISLTTRENFKDILNVWGQLDVLSSDKELVFINDEYDDLEELYVYSLITKRTFKVTSMRTAMFKAGLYKSVDGSLIPYDVDKQDQYCTSKTTTELSEMVRLLDHGTENDEGDITKQLKEFTDGSLSAAERVIKRTDVDHAMIASDHKLETTLVTQNYKTMAERESVANAAVMSDIKTSTAAVDGILKVAKAVIK